MGRERVVWTHTDEKQFRRHIVSWNLVHFTNSKTLQSAHVGGKWYVVEQQNNYSAKHFCKCLCLQAHCLGLTVRHTKLAKTNKVSPGSSRVRLRVAQLNCRNQTIIHTFNIGSSHCTAPKDLHVMVCRSDESEARPGAPLQTPIICPPITQFLNCYGFRL